MKIAFILESFPALSQTFILSQVVGLIKQGHEIDIYAYGKSQKFDLQKYPEIERYDLLKHVYYQPAWVPNRFGRAVKGLCLLVSNFLKDPQLIVRSLNVFRYGKYAFGLQTLYSVIPFLGKRPKYDIIQCHFGFLGLTGMWLRDMGAIDGKLVTAFHGVDISQNIQAQGENLYDELFVAGDLFLPACDHWRKRLLELGCCDDKILVHRMGIDFDKFSFTPRNPEKVDQILLVTVARLTEKKGLEYAIRAVSKVARKFPKVQYNIVGEGILRPRLESLIQELNLEGQVKLLGSMSQQEVAVMLGNSHLFIHPSVTANNGDQEATPVSIQEAMAMGLPILSTYHGGIPELVENTISGYLVPERDVDALVDKLTQLLKEPERLVGMGREGRLRVLEHHDINRQSARLSDIYKSLSLDKVDVLSVVTS